MKKIFITLALAGILSASVVEAAEIQASAPVVAADAHAITTKIEKANSSMTTVECKFSQVRTIKASGFDQPVGDYIIASGTKFYVHRGPKTGTFDTQKNATVGNMAGTLIGCVKGNPEKVAADNGAQISVKESGDGYVVTLTNDNAARRGYSKIVLTYRKSDCLLVKMVMDEPTGISTLYEMKEIKKNASFPDDVFKLPAK